MDLTPGRRGGLTSLATTIDRMSPACALPTSDHDLDALFAEMQPALLRAATRWAPAEVVDDVVQDTWVGVLNGIDRFEGRSQLSTWVFGILWRQCCRQWRKIDSKMAIDIEPEELALESVDVDPGRLVELRDDVDRTMDAIEDLPERYRQVIGMRDVLDRSASETAATMNLSQANQRVLLHRARNRVRSTIPDLVAS
ncbi:MAG: RNA polymerase sigma factor [Acidimicrobiales bacterium]